MEAGSLVKRLIKIIQVREDGSSNQDTSSEGGKEWLDSGCILKVETPGFADGLDEEYERNRGVNWNEGVTIN